MNLLLPQVAAAFLLTFARVGTLVMLMPGVGEQTVSPRLRLAFALLVSLLLYPLARPFLSALAGPALVTTLVGEVLVGLVLGLTVRMVLAALQTAGTVIAQQLGLGYAMSVDPTMGAQQPSIGNFLTLLGLTLIFAADLHHIAISAIGDSYALLPPAGVPQTGDAVSLALRAVSRGFALAVQISAPFIVFAILFNLGLGVLSRLMPQLQVFFVGVPASILIGMAILMAVLGVIMSVFVDDLGRWLDEFRRG